MLKNAPIKKLLLCVAVLISQLGAEAQWVNIIDSNFGKWLNTNGYNQCLQSDLSGNWQLDTTCNKVVTDTAFIMGFPQGQIYKINGLKYFDNVTYVHIWGVHVLWPNYSTIMDFPPNTAK